MNESILITGANAGLGKETARTVSIEKRNKKGKFLFCRIEPRAEAAKKDLEEKTGKKIFEIIIGDVTIEILSKKSSRRNKKNLLMQ